MGRSQKQLDNDRKQKMNKATLAIVSQLDFAVVDKTTGRIYFNSVDLTNEIEKLIELTVRHCINAADCMNDCTNSEWDQGVRAAIRKIKNEFQGG